MAKISMVRTDSAGRTYTAHKFSSRVSARKQSSPFIVTIKQAQFMDVINKWPGMTEKQIEAILDEVQQRALVNITARTPVLTGEAKAQWFWMKPTRWERFIGNNAPHIRRLEHGWSSKPNKWFMVRSTEKKIPFWVNQIAKRLWSGTVFTQGKIAA